MSTTSTDRIEKQVLLRAPRARVWRALTDIREFGSWFGVRDGEQASRRGRSHVGGSRIPVTKPLVFEATSGADGAGATSLVALAPGAGGRAAVDSSQRAHRARDVHARGDAGRDSAHRRRAPGWTRRSRSRVAPRPSV